jgi:hypothetical protein
MKSAMTASTFLSALGTTLAGVFRLQSAAFAQAASASQEAILVALTIVILAGLSEAVAQSIVLFVNRVRPARFVCSWAIDALLFLFGYAFVVLSTWAVSRVPGLPHLGLKALAIVFALSYAPLLFSFLAALPYFGPGILTLLRTWHLLAMVVGVAAIGRVGLLVAAICVALGWIVMVLAQRSFGKPIAMLGTRILDAVAGVTLVDDERLIVGRAVSSVTALDEDRRDGDSRPVAVAHRAAAGPRVWKVVLGLCGVALLALAVALAFEPLRGALVEAHMPWILRLPVDLIWLAILAGIVSAIMAPLETLGWWAGSYGDRIETTPAAPQQDARPVERIVRYAIYLDGVAQSSSRYTADIEGFLDALAAELPPGVRLIRGVMVYSVMNRPLEDDPLWSRLWSFIDWERFGASIPLAARMAFALIVNLRNALIVMVSADPRYGPMYNFGVAYVMYRSLMANGYRPRSGIPVTLIGYSGGAQMACGAAGFLKAAIEAPIEVISLGGVISGDDSILTLEHLYHLVGSRDAVERIGPLMFPSRWAIVAGSDWNRARRLGRVTEIPLGPVGHRVPGGMLDPAAKLPDGRSYLRQTLDYIEGILAGAAPTGYSARESAR